MRKPKKRNASRRNVQIEICNLDGERALQLRELLNGLLLELVKDDGSNDGFFISIVPAEEE